MPATEKSWQGVPPTRISGAAMIPSSTSRASLVISPRGTAGQRWANTADGKGSISANQTQHMPGHACGLDAAADASVGDGHDGSWPV